MIANHDFLMLFKCSYFFTNRGTLASKFSTWKIKHCYKNCLFCLLKWFILPSIAYDVDHVDHVNCDVKRKINKKLGYGKFSIKTILLFWPFFPEGWSNESFESDMIFGFHYYFWLAKWICDVVQYLKKKYRLVLCLTWGRDVCVCFMFYF